jgi:hypothetical protein
VRNVYYLLVYSVVKSTHLHFLAGNLPNFALPNSADVYLSGILGALVARYVIVHNTASGFSLITRLCPLIRRLSAMVSKGVVKVICGIPGLGLMDVRLLGFFCIWIWSMEKMIRNCGVIMEYLRMNIRLDGYPSCLKYLQSKICKKTSFQKTRTNISSAAAWFVKPGV